MRRLLKSLLIPAVAVAGASCGSSSAPNLCANVKGLCTALESTDTNMTIQTAINAAAPGETLVFGAGTFNFTNGLTFAASQTNITVMGQGMDKTIFDFTGQAAGSDGIDAMGNGFVIENLTVENTAGDAVKVEGATGVTFDGVHVLWTAANLTKHGAYGLYPVSCTNVLIQNSKAEGAADSGVYVGQSNEIVVRNTTAQGDVAGIEIENSHFADVHDNTATGNAAGVMVFALPNLQQTDCHDVRVFNNMIITNNHLNFAAQGDIVSQVPAGVGLMVMASNNVEAFGNTLMGNETAQTAIVSYYIADSSWTPAMTPTYYGFPTNVWIHDNTYSAGGQTPDLTNPLGVALNMTKFSTPNVVPDIVWDGIVDTGHTGGMANDPMNICISGNGSATWANLHADNMPGSNFGNFSVDATNNTCTLTALPPVTFPGLMP
jgi:parallel beta-helix repeat protein